MEFHIHPNAADFLQHNQAFLEKEEVANGLLLGRAIELKEQPDNDEQTTYFSVRQHANPIFACIQTPPYHFIFSTSTENAWMLILDHLLMESLEVPGLIGPRKLVNSVAGYWSEKTGKSTVVEMRQLIYRLDQVIPGPEKAGYLRLAKAADLMILQGWVKAFSKESLGQILTTEVAAKMAEQKMKDGHLYVWDDGGAVLTMAAITRPTPNGICINYVYTPPAHRKQGLASACVATLSQRMLDQGFSFCTLFTDEDFPTSNRIYKRMGYQEACTFASIRLE